MAVFLIPLVAFALVLPGSSTGVRFSGVTWNLNGVAKLNDNVLSTVWLRDYDVIYLQETYSLSEENAFELPGYLAHHSMAIYTGRRPSRGVTSLFRINAFVDGAIQRIFSPFDWTVVSRWSRPSQPGLLFVNTYLPIHSDGITRSEVLAFRDYIRDLMLSNPGDAILMGGDMNFDPWRNAEDRISGYPIPALQRLAHS